MNKIKHGNFLTRQEYGTLLEVATRTNKLNEQLSKQFNSVIDFLNERGLTEVFNEWNLNRKSDRINQSRPELN